MNTAELLIQMKDPDLETRILAIKRIGMAHDQSLVKHLVKLLLDPHFEIREATIFSLGALGDLAIIKPVVNCLEDEEKNVQLAAIKVLGEFRTIQATKPLIRLISKADLDLKLPIIKALGQIQDKNALFPLIDLLSDRDPDVRIKTLVSLGKFGDERAIDPIISQLKKESSVSQIAALTLGKFQGDKIIPALVQLLESRESKTRECAVIALGMQQNPDIIDPLIKILNDENSGVRQAATTALSEFKDSKTIHQFILRLSDSDSEIRATSARALGKMGDINATPRLKILLKDSSDNVRIEAIKSLGLLKATDATKNLLRLLKDRNLEIRKASIESIGQIEASIKSHDSIGRKVEKLLGSLAIRPLMRQVNDKEMVIKAAGAVALAKIHHNHFKFQKAAAFYEIASKECLTWDYRQSYYEACKLGCEVLARLKKNDYEKSESIFYNIEDLLKGAAKLSGYKSFVSNSLWTAVQSYITIHTSKKKEEFISHFQEYGLKLMLTQKKLPQEYQSLLDKPQDNLNKTFQIINKRGLTLEEAREDIETLKSDLFELIHDILVIEPIEISNEYNQEKTIRIIENMIIDPDFTGEFSSPSSIIAETKMADIISQQEIPLTNKSMKNYYIDEIEIKSNSQQKKSFSFSLVQLLKGARKSNPGESIESLWGHNIERYYNLSSYKHERIFQFTTQAINFRVKPKIIGFMDDAIYDDCTLVIFPENSIPHSYMEKLHGYADHYNLFIIAGFEHLQDENNYSNRAYVIAPNDRRHYFQQKNTPSSFNFSSNSNPSWKENFTAIIPPQFRIFSTFFGKFIIFIGEDFSKYQEFIPHLVDEHHLNFILFLNNNYEDEHGMIKYANLSSEMGVPLLYVNTGQFGGTAVFEPNGGIVGNRGVPIRDDSEAIFHWEYNPETQSPDPSKSTEKTIKLPSHSKDALQEMLNKINPK